MTMFTAPNGMNFSRSVNNPTSRLNRIRDYLITNGPQTKRNILYNVFGKSLPTRRYYNPDNVTRGWGTYVFGLAVKYGYFTKVRRDNSVYWSVT